LGNRNRRSSFALQGETRPIVGEGLVAVLLQQIDLRPSPAPLPLAIRVTLQTPYTTASVILHSSSGIRHSEFEDFFFFGFAEGVEFFRVVVGEFVEFSEGMMLLILWPSSDSHLVEHSAFHSQPSQRQGCLLRGVRATQRVPELGIRAEAIRLEHQVDSRQQQALGYRFRLGKNWVGQIATPSAESARDAPGRVQR